MDIRREQCRKARVKFVQFLGVKKALQVFQRGNPPKRELLELARAFGCCGKTVSDVDLAISVYAEAKRQHERSVAFAPKEEKSLLPDYALLTIPGWKPRRVDYNGGAIHQVKILVDYRKLVVFDFEVQCIRKIRGKRVAVMVIKEVNESGLGA